MTAQDSVQAGNIDVAIGIVPPVADPMAIESWIARMAQEPLGCTATLIHPPLGSSQDAASAHQPDWNFISDQRLSYDRSALAQSVGQSFRVIFEIARKLDARACAIITSDLSSVTQEWVRSLSRPILDDGVDLVTPCYSASAFDGLINHAVVYPMVRALYGKRVRNPLGPDFGLSQKLLERMAGGGRPRLHPAVSLVAEAIATNMRICQTWLGPRIYAPVDWTNVGPLISQVLAALFLDVERFAPWWQRARGSEPVEERGTQEALPAAEPPFQPEVLMQRFQIGARGLIQTWGTILPPSTLVELQRLAQQPAATFFMPDETWARIVYDFALAHRLRPPNREQILRAFTPIYLGWVASYALGIKEAEPSAVEERIEELALAFENTKPYFVSRWRWPDRFNP